MVSAHSNNQTDPKIDKGISELVGSLTDPIIVMPGGWGEDLPDWIKEQITVERLIENFKSLEGEEMLGTDAEVVAYLFTASLTAAMPHNWNEIYLYMADQVYKRHNKEGNGLPADIQVSKLDQSQERDLLHFRRWLYEARVKARQNKDAASGGKKRKV